jgi:pimeloyl-ACP methyl ester carboxylesterase
VRWPSRELVTDRSQGVQLATIQELARYWATDYDWRACEAKLNALPQFTTEIDGVDIHFIHVTSPHADALPLIMTHGWPGSVIELLDSYQKISRAFVDGQPAGHLSRDTIVDNITLYWLTGTGASAARSYWESGRAAALAAGQAPPEVSIPVGFTTFPGEIWRSPRSWVEQAYPNLTYFNEVDKGGHFAAWEEPELFSEEIRAAFRSLR